MIKAILFDVGGTFLKGSGVEFVTKACDLLGIQNDIRQKEEITFNTDLNLGKITVEECFRTLFPVPISDAQMKKLKKMWTNNWVATPEMLGLVKKLKKHYILAVLSNSDKLNADTFLKKGIYSYFDHLILSHELGVIKPEKRIYEIALEKIGLPAEDCLFIDDQEGALVPARELGMKTIHFRTLEQLREDLNALLTSAFSS